MIGNVNVPGALATDIASVSSVANEALSKANQAISGNGSGLQFNDTTNNKTYSLTLKLVNGEPEIEYEEVEE